MRLVRQLSAFRWAARKLRLPIQRGDLVLDVGAGGNPLPRADVLLERYSSGQHRNGAAAVTDRPTVFADACKMPFRDKAFDYVVAFHVLEHMTDPGAFLRELSRVAKAGYVETPNVLFERLIPYPDHCLEIMEVEGCLVIRKKPTRITDEFLSDLRVTHASTGWERLFTDNPELFHVRYFWRDNVKFEIVNPEETCDWYGSMSLGEPQETVQEMASTGLRGMIGRQVRRHHVRAASDVDLRSLLVCPACKGALGSGADELSCRRCARAYRVRPWPTFVDA